MRYAIVAAAALAVLIPSAAPSLARDCGGPPHWVRTYAPGFPSSAKYDRYAAAPSFYRSSPSAYYRSDDWSAKRKAAKRAAKVQYMRAVPYK